MNAIIRDAIDAGYQLTIEKIPGGILVQLTGRKVYEKTIATTEEIGAAVFDLRADSDAAGDAPLEVAA